MEVEVVEVEVGVGVPVEAEAGGTAQQWWEECVVQIDFVTVLVVQNGLVSVRVL